MSWASTIAVPLTPGPSSIIIGKLAVLMDLKYSNLMPGCVMLE